MQAWMPWVLGAVGGGGVIAVWYGLKDVRAPDDAPGDASGGAAGGNAGRKRRGLLLVNLGVLLICGSLALTMFAR